MKRTSVVLAVLILLWAADAGQAGCGMASCGAEHGGHGAKKEYKETAAQVKETVAQPKEAVVETKETSAPAKVQTTCPVMGGPIDKKVYVEKDGKRIYACCKGCVAALEKEFAKYAAELEKSGVAVEKIRTTGKTEKNKKSQEKQSSPEKKHSEHRH